MSPATLVAEPFFVQRIRQELQLLAKRGFHAELHQANSAYFVLYPAVETDGASRGLPSTVDVLVPVPAGYPASYIDMPALETTSRLVPHVVGGSNPQSEVVVNGRQWKVLSYHPYLNGGGPPWNPAQHGFHDYYTHLYTWLHRLL